VRERHTKLEEFAGWLACLRRVQAQEGQRQQHQETALALWDMYLAYGGKPLPDQQDKFDEMLLSSRRCIPLSFPTTTVTSLLSLPLFKNILTGLQRPGVVCIYLQYSVM